MIEHASIFDAAFAPSEPEPMEVEYLDDDRKIANVTDGDVTLLVTGYYCAHCRWGPGRGEVWCRHKERAFGGGAIAGHYREYAREMKDAQDQRETYRDALDVGIQ